MIKVTSPLLPDLEDFGRMLEQIWESGWITNMGCFHERLEKELTDYLKVPYISLFTNGTLPLLTAIQALELEGEVITTPYSFVATTHALWWNKITPVFVDVDPRTGNMDPEKIEAAITERTSAILPVHVYGQPCDTARIEEIATRHGLKVIYDAAHAFGVEKDGRSILTAGDLATISFHATKVFNTIEGGAIICKDEDTKRKIDFLKNFGFEDETTVVGPGINSKMDEIRAAYGLLNLRKVGAAIEARHSFAEKYRDLLSGVRGIRMLNEDSTTKYNYAYFPIFVDEKTYGITRDDLYGRMQQEGIYGRRYFYPLISSFNPYDSLESATPENLPVANGLACSVICLPMHHELNDADIRKVVDCIISNGR